MENLNALTEELGLDTNTIVPIKRNVGLIAYRKYLWALKFIGEKVVKLKEYRSQIVEDVDIEIKKQEANIDRIKEEIKQNALVDPISERTKTKGRKLVLPDIATVSVSKENRKVDINDSEAVLDELGNEFIRETRPSLDTTKAKQHILETNQVPKGATIESSRTLSIRFKK